MPSFPRPDFSFAYDLDTEIQHLRSHRRTRRIPRRRNNQLLLATWNIANFGRTSATGSMASPTPRGRRARRLFRGSSGSTGGVLHGVRSTDIDCSANPELQFCQGANPSPDPQSDSLYMLRNASSLEAALGFRWELRQLNRGETSSARFYVNAEYGFLAVTDDDEDVMDLTFAGLGLMATQGKFQGSYLEIGLGDSQVFERNRTGRLKVDALLKWRIPGRWDVSGIAQIKVDADGGSGADSIQSYFGFAYSFFGSKKKKAEVPASTPAPPVALAAVGQPGQEDQGREPST